MDTQFDSSVATHRSIGLVATAADKVHCQSEGRSMHGRTHNATTGPTLGAMPLQEAFAQLTDLNRRFFESPVAWAAEHIDWCALPVPVRDELSALPFPLFALDIEVAMAGVHATDGSSSASRTSITRIDDDGVALDLDLAVAATSFAWHLARIEPQLASVCLGIGRASALRLRKVAAGELGSLTRGVASTLGPRWSRNRYFWREFVAMARHPTGERVESLRLLGRQLLAADILRIASRDGDRAASARRCGRLASLPRNRQRLFAVGA